MTDVPRIFDLEHPALWGRVQPDSSTTLTNYYGDDQYDAVFDQVSPANLLAILVDEMKVRISPQGLSGTFDGSFLVYDASDRGWAHISSACSSASHVVTFTRD